MRVDLRLVYSGCLTPSQSRSRALLSRQIRRVRRRILHGLMKGLVNWFERTHDDTS